MNIDDRLKDAANRTKSSLAGATVPPLRERRPGRWASAALAAAMVVVVVGAAALLTRGSVVPTTASTEPVVQTTVPGRGTSMGTTTPTTGSSVTSTTTAPGLLTPLDGWSDAGADPAVFENVAVTSAVTVDGTIVVAGCSSGDGGVQGFPAWTSQDAVSWEQATGLGSAGTSGFGCLSDITATPFGLFARGGSLFHSVDGRTWQEVDLPSQNGVSKAFVVDAIFSATDRLTVLLSTAGEAESRWTVLYTTTDGTNWTEGPADSAALFDSSTVGDVLATEAGLIAVGASPGGEFVPTATVWVSDDGLHWQRVTGTGADFAEAFMNAVIETRSGFIAVGGSSATGLMAAWTSPDGVTWHREPGSEEQTDAAVAGMSANAITQVDGILFAAGEDFDARRSDPQGRLALWTSADGATWSRMQGETYAVPFDIIRLGSDLIGFWPPRQWIDIQQPVQVLKRS